MQGRGVEELPLTVGAGCGYHEMVAPAVEALAGSAIPVAAVSTGFPAGLTPLETRVRGIGQGQRTGDLGQGAGLAGQEAAAHRPRGVLQPAVRLAALVEAHEDPGRHVAGELRDQRRLLSLAPESLAHARFRIRMVGVIGYSGPVE